jgi:hypothetical protein
MKDMTEFCAESHEIPTVYDATKAYAYARTPENRQRWIEAVRGWRHQPSEAVFPESVYLRERYE